MATTKSVNVTAMEALPFTVLSSRVLGGSVKGFLDTQEVADGAAGDISIFSPLPVDATLVSIKLATDALGGSATADIGFYKKNTDGSYTVVDADAIANNIDVSGALVLTEYRFSVQGIETVQEPIWQLANLTARPEYDVLYVGLTFDAETAALGTASVQVQFIY